MKLQHLLTATALVALLSLSAPAHSATSPDDAKALESQLAAYFADLGGPLYPANARPITVTPEGDGFQLRSTAPDSMAAIVPPGTSVSLKVTPLDQGRWQLDDLRLPNPLIIQVPAPAAPGQAKTSTSKEPTPATAPTTISTENAASHGVFDPSYTTQSQFDWSSDNNRSTGPNSETTSAHSESHLLLTPVGDGRVDATVSSRSEHGQQAFTPTGNAQPVIMSWGHGESMAAVKALSPQMLGDLIRTASRMMALRQADAPVVVPGTTEVRPTQPPMTPEEQALAKQQVLELFGLGHALDVTATLDNVALTALPVSATIDKIFVAMSQNAADGHAKLGLRVALQGLTSPGFPPGVFQDYAPRNITLAPHVAGLSPDELQEMAIAMVTKTAPPPAAAPDAAQPKPDELAAMLAKGPIEFGMDELLIDLGPARVTGTGSLHLTARNTYDATAELVMTGLDGMIDRVKREPNLAQVLAPLSILRGVGKQDGETTRWSVVAHNGQVLVNGVDLASLTPRPAARPAPKTP